MHDYVCQIINYEIEHEHNVELKAVFDGGSVRGKLFHVQLPWLVHIAYSATVGDEYLLRTCREGKMDWRVFVFLAC